jgi:hypothetical protein
MLYVFFLRNFIVITNYGTFPENAILSLATGLRENSARETGRKEGDLPRSAS